MTQGTMADYEALAEVRLLLEGLPSDDAIVCFCTRSIMWDQDLLFKGIKGFSLKRFDFILFVGNFFQLLVMCFVLGHIMTSSENSSDEDEESGNGNMVTFENAVSFITI